jgi:hypothetical protein
MKSLAGAVGIAVDSVGFLVGVLAWGFIVWAPVIIGVVVLVAAGRQSDGLLFIFVAFSSIFVLLGLFLKWLAKGIVGRGALRTVFSAVVLALSAISFESPSLAARERLSQLQRLDREVMAVFLFCASAALLLSLLWRLPRENG